MRVAHIPRFDFLLAILERFVSSHITPVVGWALSAFILAVSLTLSTPKPDDLVEVSGTVRSAVEVTGGRTPRGGVIFALDDAPDRYRTRSLGEHLAGERSRNIAGSFVRTFVEKTPPLPRSYGAARETWGLVVNGETIQSVKSALDSDRARKHVLLPSIALVLAAVSFLRFLYEVKVRGPSHGAAGQLKPAMGETHR
jgi:hypothetical protein